MMAAMDTRSAQALIRFGLGARGSEAPPADPTGWLARQLDGPDPALALGGPGSADGLVALREDRADRQRKDLADKPQPTRVRDMVRADFIQMVDIALTTQAPFRERLVWFWANHFTVSLRRGEVSSLVMPFVREAIRPHVNGRFADMLLAVMRHPAMLMYLDNQASIGPDSLAGQRRRQGLNENLARECLELHTLSPAAGYTQTDVTEFAKVITGWSFELPADPPGFIFRPNAHQPGSKTVMGQVFPEGEQGGVAALAWLADHPATHRHLATKLVRHFVADDPPTAAVARIEAVLARTRGDLRAASLELIRLPEAWAPLTKLRTPTEFVFAAVRALDLPAGQRPNLDGVFGALGQPLFNAPEPNGWPDRAADWAAPEAMLRRVDWAYGAAGRATAIDPEQLAAATLGPLLRPATVQAMQHAGSRRDAMTLLLTSPEFQRR